MPASCNKEDNQLHFGNCSAENVENLMENLTGAVPVSASRNQFSPTVRISRSCSDQDKTLHQVAAKSADQSPTNSPRQLGTGGGICHRNLLSGM